MTFRGDMTGWHIGRAVYAAARMSAHHPLTPAERFFALMAQNVRAFDDVAKAQHRAQVEAALRDYYKGQSK